MCTGTPYTLYMVISYEYVAIHLSLSLSLNHHQPIIVINVVIHKSVTESAPRSKEESQDHGSDPSPPDHP